jgi:hypothetical protein
MQAHLEIKLGDLAEWRSEMEKAAQAFMLAQVRDEFGRESD